MTEHYSTLTSSHSGQWQHSIGVHCTHAVHAYHNKLLMTRGHIIRSVLTCIRPTKHILRPRHVNTGPCTSCFSVKCIFFSIATCAFGHMFHHLQWEKVDTGPRQTKWLSTRFYIQQISFKKIPINYGTQWYFCTYY